MQVKSSPQITAWEPCNGSVRWTRDAQIGIRGLRQRGWDDVMRKESVIHDSCCESPILCMYVQTGLSKYPDQDELGSLTAVVTRLRPSARSRQQWTRWVEEYAFEQEGNVARSSPGLQNARSGLSQSNSHPDRARRQRSSYGRPSTSSSS